LLRIDFHFGKIAAWQTPTSSSESRALSSLSSRDLLPTAKPNRLTAHFGGRCRQASGCDNLNWRANTPMDPTQLSDDFRDFLKCLNDAGVEYLLIGGHAVAYHGYVRPTRDLDVWIAVSPENAKRVVQAVKSFFGNELSGLSEKWFLDLENVTRFGAVPNLIEVVQKISGGNFQEAYARRIVTVVDGLATNLLSLDDLIANKKASARLKDLADIQELTK
jgi:hypothetical protein